MSRANVVSVALVVGCLVAPVRSLTGQLPPDSMPAPDGYYWGPTTELPDSLVEVREGGLFRIEIARVAADGFQRSLIEAAERLYPTVALIHAAREREGFVNLAGPRPVAEPRWWWGEGDGGAREPFAVTGAAALAMAERVRHLGGEQNPSLPYEQDFEQTARMSYSATVTASSDPSAAFDVVLDLAFGVVCGTRCGWGFGQARRIQFDASGRVLGVTGDGRPGIWRMNEQTASRIPDLVVPGTPGPRR